MGKEIDIYIRVESQNEVAAQIEETKVRVDLEGESIQTCQSLFNEIKKSYNFNFEYFFYV